MKKLNNMKTKIISKILLTLGLVFVLGSATLRCAARGLLLSIAQGMSPGENRFIRRDMNPAPPLVGIVNFSVSGTAIPGVDYVPLVSPVIVAGPVPPSR